MTPEANQSEYDSIQFIDYLRVILKRKYFILFVFLLCVVGALAYRYFMPKSYFVATTLAIGKYGKIDDVAGGLLESPTQILAKAGRSIYQDQVRQKLQIPEDKFPRVGVHNPTDTTFIVFDLANVPPSQLEQSKVILSEFDNIILTEHQDLFQKKIDFLEKQIVFVEADKENLTKDIQRIQLKIISLDSERKNLEAKVEALQKVLPYQQDPGTQFALFDAKEKVNQKAQEIENLYLEINNLNAKINDIESQSNVLNEEKNDFVPTTILQPVTVGESAVQRSLIVVMIWGALGLFAGIFIAFVREWWDRAKMIAQT